MPLDDEIELWTALESQGMPITRIAKMSGKSRQTVSKALRKVRGVRPKSVPLGRTQHNIRVHPDLFRRVEELAKSMGLTIAGGDHAGRGSVAELIELIGAGHVVIRLAGTVPDYVKEYEECDRDEEAKGEWVPDGEWRTGDALAT